MMGSSPPSPTPSLRVNAPHPTQDDPHPVNASADPLPDARRCGFRLRPIARFLPRPRAFPGWLLASSLRWILRSTWFLLAASPALAGGTLTNCTYESLSSALIGGGLVRFECDGTITVRDTLVINASTVLDAVGRTVTLSSGMTNRPLILIRPSVQLAARSLTLSGGQSTEGGAIYSEGSVVLDGCTLSDNTATQGRGGAVFVAQGDLTASACAFSDNQAAGTDGEDGAAGDDDFGTGDDGEDGGQGQTAYGGAIYTAEPGLVTLTNCVFEANTAIGGSGGTGGDGGSGTFQGGNGGRGGVPGGAYGGAIYSQGWLEVIDCTFAENTATGGDGGAGGAAGAGAWSSATGSGAPGGAASGGALYCAGTLVLTGSSLYGNTASGGAGEAGGAESGGEGLDGEPGGAARAGACLNDGMLAARNCTFYGNLATGGAAGSGGPGGLIGGDGGNGGSAWGGGLYSLGPAGITNCTFAANEVVGGSRGEAGDGFASGDNGRAGSVRGANLAAEAQLLRLRNTLLAGTNAIENAYGALEDAGHNLSSDATPPFVPGTSSTNHVDPLLGDFGDYGGLTYTLPLKRQSPALDAAAAEASVTTDQRGAPRAGTHNPRPDIGAFELQPALVSGWVATLRPEASFPVRLVSATETNQLTTGADGRFTFVTTGLGAQRLELAAPTNAAYSPTRYDLFLTEFSEGESNLIFYPRRAELAVGTPDDESKFSLLGVGLPSTAFHIQAVTALTGATPVWSSLATNRSDANGGFSFVQTNAVQFPVRLYRAVQP